MKKQLNILTVYNTEKGSIKEAVIQKKGKMMAHLAASPELIKSTLTEHPFLEDVNRELFSKICDDFILPNDKKHQALLKKQKH